MGWIKEVLAEQVPGLYAVGCLTLEGRRYYGAASEDRDGRMFLIDAETKMVSEIEGGRGGVMAVVDGEDGKSVLCIEEFYPVFDSATAKVIRIELEKTADGYRCGSRQIVAEVPYVHRIALLKEADGWFLAAGKLCRHKEQPDDWSTSGTMEIGWYDGGAVDSFECVCDGLWKHHAMYVKKNADGYDDLYYGGTAGAFKTVRQNGAWVTRQLLDAAVSDIVMEDLDGDGTDEIAIIEEFHGDKAVVFKDYGNGYERTLELPLNFGHVLWGGSFLGKPGLITGSRGGEKQLICYRFADDQRGRLYVTEETVMDAGEAPAQITVSGTAEDTAVVAANHGMKRLVRYRYSRG